MIQKWGWGGGIFKFYKMTDNGLEFYSCYNFLWTSFSYSSVIWKSKLWIKIIKMRKTDSITNLLLKHFFSGYCVLASLTSFSHAFPHSSSLHSFLSFNHPIILSFVFYPFMILYFILFIVLIFYCTVCKVLFGQCLLNDYHCVVLGFLFIKVLELRYCFLFHFIFCSLC